MLNFNKIIIAFTISIFFVICGCVNQRLPLSKSEADIRNSILKITPLGTPIELVETRIKTKIHPKEFEHDKNTIISGLTWPLGKEHYNDLIECRINSGFFANVDAYWAFDDKDLLLDVSVLKTPNAL